MSCEFVVVGFTHNSKLTTQNAPNTNVCVNSLSDRYVGSFGTLQSAIHLCFSELSVSTRLARSLQTNVRMSTIENIGRIASPTSVAANVWDSGDLPTLVGFFLPRTPSEV
jgi:hypothetical protein